MNKMIRRGVLSGMLLSVAILGACTPPAPPTAVPWKFQGTKVTVNSSQDETCVFGVCVNTHDEPYLMNVNFSVKIGVAGSAQTWVSGGHGNGYNDLGAGQSTTSAGGWQGTANFSPAPLDIADLLNSANHLEVFGSYTWAMEEDTVGIGPAASGTANILKDALNQTLALGSIPSDLGILLDLILDNIGSAFGILAGNIPLFGLGDDVMGGGLYLGIAAKGDLGALLDGAIGSASIPNINIPVPVPPDITTGGIYTMTGAKSFNATWSCCGGTHSYTLTEGPA